ncbi:acetylornithine deacetylase [Marinobacterium litorale]|uniref:acetylornithine deacetylase n=1 Tax=Marinobacterium litorale TaxID=404770 RepID=UPI00040DA7E2|nr:acetylornithine deacetylase [Marinobacterium litorale]
MSRTTPNALAMLRELIAAPSISSTTPQWDQSNLAVIEHLHTWLDGLGFNCEVMPVPGEKNKANLIATLGSGSGGLVLSGHTDTVPCDPELWLSDPFRMVERDQRLYGLGTCDMKGFLALAIEAAKEFADQPLKQPLIILATADEESSMSGARALAEAGKPKARAAIIGEPSSLRPVRMHKGMMMEAVRIEGRAGHSSDPSLGANALDAMHGVLNELSAFRQELKERHRNSHFRVDYPTMNFGCIHGGDNPNRICGQCELEFDLRPLPGMTMEGLRDAISERLLPLGERFGVKLEARSLFPGIPPFENPETQGLVALAEKLTGHTSEAVAFGTEAPFLQGLGMDTIVMGPGSIDQAHQPDEFLALDQIQPTLDILKQMITRYCL